MSDMSQRSENLPTTISHRSETILISEGTVQNGRIVDVVFPFYTGPAGLRDRGGGQVEFAFFRQLPLRFWREALVEGSVAGEPYRVIGSKVSTTTKAMIVVSALKI